MPKTRLLLTCSGPRAYLLPLFQKSPEFGRLIAVDSIQDVPMASFCKNFYQVPEATDSTAYISIIKELIQEHHIDAIVSAHDIDLQLLGKTDQFNNVLINGVKEPQLSLLIDKWQLILWLKKHGFSVPDTCLPRKIDDIDKKQPLLLKPRRGSGSVGITLCKNIEDVAPESDDTLIQSYIQGEEFNLDILCNLDGETVSVIVKRKVRMRYGSTELAETVIDHALIELGVALGQTIGHLGSIDVDVMRYKDKDYILDVNPRIGGGFPFSCYCSPDFLNAFLKILRGDKVSPFLGEYHSGCKVGRFFSLYEM